MESVLKRVLDQWYEDDRPPQRIFDFNNRRKLRWRCITQFDKPIEFKDLTNKAVGITSVKGIEDAWTLPYENFLRSPWTITSLLMENLNIKPVFDLRPGHYGLLLPKESDVVLVAAFLDQSKEEFEDDYDY